MAVVSLPNFQNSPRGVRSSVPILQWERFREGDDALKVAQRVKSKAGI